MNPARRGVKRIYPEADGVTVLEANGGARALELLDQHDVDLALVDIMMPKVDGYQLIKAIRRREKYIPVIVISAKVALSDRVLGIDQMNGEYTKAFEICGLRLTNQRDSIHASAPR